jgi:hypothetical protein
VDGSLVLETRFETASGVVVLTDLLAVGENERGHDLGREAPHALLRLTTPVGAEIVEGSARMRFVLHEDETVDFALQDSSVEDGTVRQWNAEDIACAAEEMLRAWTSWADMHQSYEGPWEQLVHHSGRVLQGLTYYPTGAMIAAPTTSLPEVVGGGRNWDYRFCWVRDASFNAGRALGRGVTGRGGEVLLLPDARRTRPHAPGHAAAGDLRHRRRARPRRA